MRRTPAARAARIVPAARPLAAVVAALVAAGCGSGSASTPSSHAAHSTVVAKVKTGGQPCGIAAAAGSVWVSDAGQARLLRVDPATHRVSLAVRLDPKPCAITVAAGSLWVVTQSGRLDRVRPADGVVLARIPVGDTSYQAVAAAGAIWVSNRNSRTLSRVDPRTDRVTETVQTPGMQPGGMVYTAGYLWVGDDTDSATHVLRLDPRTRRTATVRAGQRPAYLAASADAVWVSDVGDGSVTRLDPHTGTATATVPAGLSPVNLDVLPGARPQVWVPDDTGGHLTCIDAVTARPVETLDVSGDGPAVVAPIAGDVWVSMFAIGEVWQIRPAER